MSENKQKQPKYTKRFPTQKQISEINLFKNVKFVNGDRAWRIIQQKCIVFQFLSHQRVPFLQTKQYFFIVKTGTIQFSKCFKDNSTLRGQMKLLKKDQYSGFQDYPLFMNQFIEVEASPNTIIYAIKLEIFYQCFRRVIPLNSLQQKAQYLKKIIPGNTIQIQKLLNFASFIERRRCQPNSYLVKQYSLITELIVIVEGQCYSIDEGTDAKIYFRKNSIIGLDSLLNGEKRFSKTYISTRQCEVLLVPKDGFLKLYEIKYTFKEIPNELFQSITIEKNYTEVQTYQQPKQKQSPRLKSETTRKQLRSASYGNSLKKVTKFNNTYTTFAKGERVETEKSMSEMHLTKFLNRKQKLQSKAIFQYIHSKAPQLAINPSKQYCLIKPLHIKNSNYIRNFKRKLKQSASLFKSTVMVNF